MYKIMLYQVNEYERIIIYRTKNTAYKLTQREKKKIGVTFVVSFRDAITVSAFKKS